MSRSDDERSQTLRSFVPSSLLRAGGPAARAVAAGATVLRPPTDHFYGERSGSVRDPFGHEWLIGHDIESVTPEEMQRRYDELLKK